MSCYVCETRPEPGCERCMGGPGEQGMTHEERQIAKLERQLECFRAARVTWSPEVLAAVERGDVEACKADAAKRHTNWETLRSTVKEFAAEIDAMRQAFEAREAKVRQLAGALGGYQQGDNGVVVNRNRLTALYEFLGAP